MCMSLTYGPNQNNIACVIIIKHVLPTHICLFVHAFY